MILIKKYLNWFFRKPAAIWLILCLLVVPLPLIMNSFYNKEWLIRLGVLYQSIGVVAVVINIYNTRKQFGSEPLTKKFVNWWNSRPKVAGDTQYIDPDGYSASVIPLDITLTRPPEHDKSRSSDENIERLFKIIKRQNERIEAVSHECEKKIADTHNHLFSEIKDSKRFTTRVQLDLKNSALGGLELSFVGSVFILIGVVISTLPSWLITIFR